MESNSDEKSDAARTYRLSDIFAPKYDDNQTILEYK
jgi:hypothetical protein